MPTWLLAPIAGLKLPAQATQPGGIGSLESILGLPECLKIWAQACLLTQSGSSTGLFCMYF